MRNFGARHDSSNNENLGGFTTFSPSGFVMIKWAGSLEPRGVEPIDVVRAALDRLQFLQKTLSASEANAKLLVKLTQAVEEFEGKLPSIGGELNDLIPKE